MMKKHVRILLVLLMTLATQGKAQVEMQLGEIDLRCVAGEGHDTCHAKKPSSNPISRILGLEEPIDVPASDFLYLNGYKPEQVVKVVPESENGPKVRVYVVRGAPDQTLKMKAVLPGTKGFEWIALFVFIAGLSGIVFIIKHLVAMAKAVSDQGIHAEWSFQMVGCVAGIFLFTGSVASPAGVAKVLLSYFL